MKKIIFLIVISICLQGCFSSKTSPDYQTMEFARLEAKAKRGDLGAIFWLSDRYFIGQDGNKDEDKASIYFEKFYKELEKKPNTINAPWFQKAYEQQHPMAIFFLIILDIEACLKDDSRGYTEKEINQIGQKLDLLLSIQKNQSLYSPLAAEIVEALKLSGLNKLCLQIGNEYKQKNNGDAAETWFSRACQLGDMESCKLYLGQW
ncbi:hypothetical protein [Candidatus Avelusimicrobium luingense]|uniref:hypothetical protein n=1 Tax=Candidatus Avelusimicrobium luingense TaxID=3416211 RepID=UPI003D14B6CC